MRERSLDEFESIFEQASIPVLDVEDVTFARISAVLTGDELDVSVLDLAAYLKARFAAEVEAFWRRGMPADRAVPLVRDRGFEPAAEPFDSTAELVGQISIGRSQLVLLPEPEDVTTPFVDLDKLVQGTAPPILVLHRPIDEPAGVFRRILHSLTGNFQQTQNFSHSFTLVEPGGVIRLLHAVHESELQDVRDALQVAPDITARTGEDLLERMGRRGERFLKGVVAAGRMASYDVSYRVVVGEVVEMVRRELGEGGYGLLVVGRHLEGHSQVTTSDYALMRSVREIPVLAL
jgi:hypothetical protein